MDFSVQSYYKRAYEADIQQELDCVNALQATKWKVNLPVLEVMQQCWDGGQEWGDLPAKNHITPKPYPFNGRQKSELTDTELLIYKEVSKERAKAHSYNNETMSKRLSADSTLRLAQEYSQYDEFYYQWQVDFRTRKYPRETYLSPQVSDYGKALLTFAVGAEVTCPEDATWLAIHGANSFGNDKVSLIERELWVLSNTAKILQVAEEPLNCLWWMEADKPWAFLAFCFEWTEYTLAVGRGDVFITHLPCQVDGSCNGIQHLSAMLRDEKGGQAVNLSPSEKPQDIYGDVAAEATKTIQADADNGHVLAKKVLEFGVCRSIAKKPVMIVPYSGTKGTCRDGVLEALEKKGKGVFPWDEDDTYQAACYINDHIWEAISEVITGARQVMDYIKDIASLYATHNTLMSWITPTGFLVEQRYFKKKSRRIVSHLLGKEVKVDYLEDKAVVNKAKYRSSSSPNFVHSMDASALTLTVNRCKADGIHEFAMIHDSFGTHSTNLPLLNKHIREAFVDLYSENDVLGDMYVKAKNDLPRDIEIPLPPSRGSLDLSKVLTSDYFFA